MMDDLHLREKDAEILTSSTEPETSALVEYGRRPECFKSTLQEVLFVLTATMAIGMSSMTTGSVTVISSFVGRDLNMTTPEITWISAASSYVHLGRFDVYDNMD
jgi:hypothetical protein